MSLFDKNTDNDIAVRCGEAYLKRAWIRDDVTGEWVRVNSGGGAPSDIPYWVQDDKASIGPIDSSLRTIVAEDGVDVINVPGDKATHLSADALTFGDTAGNVSLEKGDVEVLKNLQTGNVTVPASGSKVLIYDVTSGKHSTTPFREYLDIDSIRLPNAENALMQIASSNLSLRNSASSSGTGLVLAHNSLMIGTRSTASFVLNVSQPRCTLTRTSMSVHGSSDKSTTLHSTYLRFQNGGSSTNLTMPMVQDLEKFNAKTPDTATVDDRLVAYNPTTQDYKLLDTSSGEILPKTYRLSVPPYWKPALAPVDNATPYETYQSWFMRFWRGYEQPEDEPYHNTLPYGVLKFPSDQVPNRYKLEEGDSLTLDFPKAAETNLNLYSAYYDTWYVIHLGPTLAPDLHKHVEAVLLNCSPDISAVNTVDVRVLPASNAGLVAFRFNAYTVFDGVSANPTLAKVNHTHPFVGSVKFTLLSTNGDNLPAPVELE